MTERLHFTNTMHLILFIKYSSRHVATVLLLKAKYANESNSYPARETKHVHIKMNDYNRTGQELQ